MDVKLILKLDKQVIEKAKEYASLQKKSLSRLVQSYLKTLVDKGKSQQEDDLEISPYARSLSNF